MNQEPSLHTTGLADPPGWSPFPPAAVPSAGSVLPTTSPTLDPRRRGLAGWWMVLAAVVVAILVVLAITIYRSHQAPPIISAAAAQITGQPRFATGSGGRVDSPTNTAAALTTPPMSPVS